MANVVNIGEQEFWSGPTGQSWVAHEAAQDKVLSEALDAVMHALTTISTGGFSNYNASFGAFQGPLEYAGALFMLLASLPFVRYIQLVAGTARPILIDSQITISHRTDLYQEKKVMQTKVI